MPSETQYDKQKKLEAIIARDEKIINIGCIVAAALVLADLLFLILYC